MALPSQVLRRIDALVAERDLPDGAGAQLAAVLERVATDRDAPTTVTEPDEALSSHVVGALDALDVPQVRAARHIADLGSGAGFPGLVLAVAVPGAHVALVESVARKGAFQRRAIEDARLTNVEAVTARAEAWAAGHGRHDLVVARALAPLGVLIEYAGPLLELGGHLVAYKGHRDEGEEADAAAAGAAVGLERVDVVAVPPRKGAQDHHLHVWSKVRETPARYPRREGMARKRPLRASSGG